MSPASVQHFLVIYDIPAGQAALESFGNDYEAAVRAYEQAEERHRKHDDIEVVLLGSDSVETLERTHSSYFRLSERHIDRMIAKELAAAGFR